MAQTHSYHCPCRSCTSGQQATAGSDWRRHKVNRELIRQGVLILQPRRTVGEELRAGWDSFELRHPVAADRLRHAVGYAMWLGFSFLCGATIAGLWFWEQA